MGMRSVSSREPVESAKAWKPRWKIQNGYVVHDCVECGGLKYVFVKSGGVAHCRNCFPDNFEEKNKIIESFQRFVVFDPNIHEPAITFEPQKLLGKHELKEQNKKIIAMLKQLESTMSHPLDNPKDDNQTMTCACGIPMTHFDGNGNPVCEVHFQQWKTANVRPEMDEPNWEDA